MARRGYSLLLCLPFLVIGIGCLVGGFSADPSVVIDDGLSQRSFLFLLGGSFLFFPLLIVIGLALGERSKRRKMENLLATGQQGEAVILGLEDTGVRINDDPQVSVLLEVRIEGYSPYKIEKTLVVPMIRLPQVQVESTIQVLADPGEPNNPDKIELLLR